MRITDLLECASAGSTSAGNIATVVNPKPGQIVVEKPKSKKIKKNALDQNESIFDGTPLKRQ